MRGASIAALRAQLVHLSVQASRIGGLWVLNSDSGKSSAYNSLRINTSKYRTRFHNFPFPRHYPIYCSHEQVKLSWLWTLQLAMLLPAVEHSSTRVLP